MGRSQNFQPMKKRLRLLVLASGIFLATTTGVWAQPSDLNSKAAELLSKQKYSESLPLFQQLVDKDGPRLDLLLGLNESYIGVGQLDKALELSQQLVTLYPDRGESHAARAHVLGNRGEPEEALTELDKAL